MYKHKTYSMGFKVQKGVLEQKIRLISSRYRKKGRPRKTDYDYKTILEIQKEYNEIMNKRMERILSCKLINQTTTKH